MSQETPNGQPTTANEVIAALRSGRLTQPRGAASLTATRQQHLRKADTEAWIMVYLDVITLLLVFFVLMLASVNVDLLGGKTELQQPLELTTGEIEQEPPEPKPFEQTSGEVTEAQPDLELARRLRESLAAHQLVEGLDIIVEPGQVNLQLPEQILFQTGRADLIGIAQTILDQIVPVLKENDFYISVEGHTDNVPIRNARFPSNWELSAARASTVIRFLEQKGIPYGRMRALGYAYTQPVATNETVEGRRANRRVRLVIHVDQEAAPKPTNVRREQTAGTPDVSEVTTGTTTVPPPNTQI